MQKRNDPQRPELSLADAKSAFQPAYFERGRRYYRQGAISQPVRRANVLEAHCEGSQPYPYQVRAKIKARGVVSSTCTCPIGGYCKHVAALLIQWIEEPESFRTPVDPTDQLQDRSKKELIALIVKMINRHPDLEALLGLSVVEASATPGYLEEKALEDQVRAAIASAGYWGNIRDLEEVIDQANDLFEVGNYKSAAVVYRAFLRVVLKEFGEALPNYDSLMEDLSNAATALVNCLAAIPEDSGQRSAIIDVLFEAFDWEFELGGYGLMDDVPEELFTQLTDAERAAFKDKIRERLSANPYQDLESSNWYKSSWSNLLLQLEQQFATPAEIESLLRAAGAYLDLFYHLVDQQRVEEALEVLAEDLRPTGNLRFEIGRWLERAGYPAEALQLVHSMESATQQPDVLQWLLPRLERSGDRRAAFRIARRLWEYLPSLEIYLQLRELSENPQIWESLRTELRRELLEDRGPGRLRALIHILLHEGSWEDAWELVEGASPAMYGRQPNSLKEEVARATESVFPDRVLAYYLEQAHHRIDHRNRTEYAVATNYLLRAKALLQQQNRAREWTNLYTELRVQYARLPALLDEMRSGGL